MRSKTLGRWKFESKEQKQKFLGLVSEKFPEAVQLEQEKKPVYIVSVGDELDVQLSKKDFEVLVKHLGKVREIVPVRFMADEHFPRVWALTATGKKLTMKTVLEKVDYNL